MTCPVFVVYLAKRRKKDDKEEDDLEVEDVELDRAPPSSAPVGHGDVAFPN